MTKSATAQQFSAVDRRAYIGCSEFAAVLGIDPFKTKLDVYNSKLGLVKEFEGNQHTLRGQRLESVAADIYTEITGNKLRRRTVQYTHPVYPFIVGHLDRIFEGQKKLAEIKCPSVAAFRKFQREGLPSSFIIQMQGYLGLSGYKEGVWIIFCADQMDAISFDVTFDAEIYEAAITKVAYFWNNHVITKIAPEIESQEKSAQIEIANVGGEATIRDDDAFINFAQELREAKQLQNDAEELLAIVQKKGLDLIENQPGIYVGGGLTLHYKEQAGRVSFDKKALAATHPEIDLSRFEKQGKPFRTFKPFFTKN